MEFSGGPAPSRLWLALLLLPAVGALFGAYVLVAPTRLAYHLTADTLTIDAALGAWDQGRVIPRAEVHDARPVRLAGAHRTAGTGMEGYCQGRWSFADLGATWIATDCRAEAVALGTSDGTVVISPPDRERFLAALERGEADDQEVPQAPHAPWMYAVALAIAALPALLGVLMTRIFKPLVYRVQSGELIVPRHFGELHVRLSGTKVQPGDMGVAARMAGSGLPGFHLGAYRDGRGGFHACSTSMRGGVWIHGERRLYITPADLPAFLDAVRQQGAVVEGAR